MQRYKKNLCYHGTDRIFLFSDIILTFSDKSFSNNLCTLVPKTERDMKKYSLMLIIAAALLLEAMGAAQFFLARRSTQEELLVKAQRDLVQSKRVAGVKAEVESAVRNIHDAVEKSIDDPDHYYVIATQMVKNNPHIVGAGIAFVRGGKDK